MMRGSSVVIVAVCFLLGAGPIQDDAAKKDLDKLQGVWQVVSMEGGKSLPPDRLKELKFTFKGNKLSHTGSDGKTTESTIKLDPSKKPKVMDITHLTDSVTLLGIYSIDGDTLKICGPRVKDGDRPTEFKASEDVDLIVLKRTKRISTITSTGNEEFETLAREWLKTCKEFTTTLETIKDKKTAEDAKDRLCTVYKRLVELERKINALSAAQQRWLNETHGKEIASNFLSVPKNNQRLRNLPDVVGVFEDTPLYWPFFGQKNAPQKLFEAMEQKLAKAKTQKVDFEIEVEAVKIKGSALLADGNRMKLTLEGKEDQKITIANNGQTGFMQIGSSKPRILNGFKNQVEMFATHLRRASIFFVGMQSKGGDFSLNPVYASLEQSPHLELSGFKMAGKEKVGSREANVIEYSVAPSKYTKGATCKVWLDTETNMPLKRILEVLGDGKIALRATEIYTRWELDPKISDELFALPK